MRLLYRAFGAVAIIGYAYTGYRAVPVLWDHAGATVAVCVGLSLLITIVIFLHDVLFGRSIFTGR